uniref:Uncharacterized protein n=1 Tax=Rhizophora mucronata TaxID=61149 RepID=A0A2P2R014_RHIMU
MESKLPEVVIIILSKLNNIFGHPVEKRQIKTQLCRPSHYRSKKAVKSRN